jgi:hypothetical protein
LPLNFIKTIGRNESAEPVKKLRIYGHFVRIVVSNVALGSQNRENAVEKPTDINQKMIHMNRKYRFVCSGKSPFSAKNRTPNAI